MMDRINRSPVSIGVLLFAVLAVLIGCHADLETVPVTVMTGTNTEAVIPVRDIPRRPAEEELVVSPDGENPYEIETTEPVEAAGIDGLRVSLEGESVGAEFEIRRGERSSRIRFAGIPGHAPDVVDMTISLPPWVVTEETIPSQTRLLFGAGESAAYRVRSLNFVRRPAIPSVSWSADAADLDDRLIVTAGVGTWRVEGLETFINDPTDAVVITYEQSPDSFDDRRRRPTASILIGDTTLQFFPRPGLHYVVFRPALWGAAPGPLVVQGDSDEFQVVGISPRPISTGTAGGVLEALPVELTELLTYPMELWRRDDFELFSWSLYPEILWVDSVDYVVQARFFKRLAFFVEKRGFIGTLVDDSVLANRHGYNAHNYRPEGLAAFYNAVEDEAFSINEYEIILRDTIEARGIIQRDETGRWQPGVGGVLAVSQESYPALRRLLIVHEAMHGVFYEEPAFRDGVVSYWRDVLTERERRYWQDAFAWMSYSPDDEYLMHNEFQAYLLQQNEAAIRWYFRSRVADRVRGFAGRFEPVDQFLAAHPTTFVDAGAAINELLFRTTGMIGGDPFCLLPADTEA